MQINFHSIDTLAFRLLHLLSKKVFVSEPSATITIPPPRTGLRIFWACNKCRLSYIRRLDNWCACMSALNAALATWCLFRFVPLIWYMKHLKYDSYTIELDEFMKVRIFNGFISKTNASFRKRTRWQYFTFPFRDDCYTQETSSSTNCSYISKPLIPALYIKPPNNFDTGIFIVTSVDVFTSG